MTRTLTALLAFATTLGFSVPDREAEKAQLESGGVGTVAKRDAARIAIPPQGELLNLFRATVADLRAGTEVHLQLDRASYRLRATGDRRLI